MARYCNDCKQKPCMGGYGPGSCVSKQSRSRNDPVIRDESAGSKKNPMIDCGSTDEDNIEGVWHTTHTCEIKVPKLAQWHLQSHRCTCGHTWR